jgi:hypothetical protein
MADYDWKDMGLRIDDSTGVLRDIGAYVNNQSLQAAITDLDTTGMGAEDKTRQQGIADRQILLNGFMNSTTYPIIAPMLNRSSATKTVEFKAAANKLLNGEFTWSNVQISGSPNTLELWSLTLHNTGALNSTSVALA